MRSFRFHRNRDGAHARREWNYTGVGTAGHQPGRSRAREFAQVAAAYLVKVRHAPAQLLKAGVDLQRVIEHREEPALFEHPRYLRHELALDPARIAGVGDLLLDAAGKDEVRLALAVFE